LNVCLVAWTIGIVLVARLAPLGKVGAAKSRVVELCQWLHLLTSRRVYWDKDIDKWQQTLFGRIV
jgi:hypothetical protein